MEADSAGVGVAAGDTVDLAGAVAFVATVGVADSAALAGAAGSAAMAGVVTVAGEDTEFTGPSSMADIQDMDTVATEADTVIQRAVAVDMADMVGTADMEGMADTVATAGDLPMVAIRSRPGRMAMEAALGIRRTARHPFRDSELASVSINDCFHRIDRAAAVRAVE